MSKEAAERAHQYSSEVFAYNVFNVYSKILCAGRVELAV